MVLPDISMTNYREAIIALTARHRVPAVYPLRYFAARRLMSYGTDVAEVFLRAAAYVNRTLKGEKPGDLPVQAPTKYKLVINLKTAKALGPDRTHHAAGERRQGDRVKRRAFIALLGGAAALPLAARAQEPSPGRPIVGVLAPQSQAASARNVEAFRKGLRDLGYVEGRNITLEIRYGDGLPERLPQLAAELVALRPAVIRAGSTAGIVAAHNATQ